jgi:hypothetical protein
MIDDGSNLYFADSGDHLWQKMAWFVLLRVPPLGLTPPEWLTQYGPSGELLYGLLVGSNCGQGDELRRGGLVVSEGFREIERKWKGGEELGFYGGVMGILIAASEVSSCLGPRGS